MKAVSRVPRIQKLYNFKHMHELAHIYHSFSVVRTTAAHITLVLWTEHEHFWGCEIYLTS